MKKRKILFFGQYGENTGWEMLMGEVFCPEINGDAV